MLSQELFPSALCILIYLIPLTDWWDKYYSCYKWETEAQRGKVTYLMSFTWKVVELRFKPKQTDLRETIIIAILSLCSFKILDWWISSICIADFTGLIIEHVNDKKLNGYFRIQDFFSWCFLIVDLIIFTHNLSVIQLKFSSKISFHSIVQTCHLIKMKKPELWGSRWSEVES